MKNFLVLIMLVICGGAAYHFWSKSQGAGATASASAPPAAATPKDKMKAICEGLDMKVQTWADTGGGNLTFVLRSPMKGTHQPQEAVEAAIRDGILREATFVSTQLQSDSFNGNVNDSTYQAVLKQ